MSLPECQVWKSNYKIAIVGGGLVGLATGIFLHRAGFHVSVFEKDEALSMTGTGLQLPATHNKVLKDLGILDKVAAHSMFPHDIVLHKYNTGNELHVMNLMPFVLDKYQAPHFVTHRADLRQSLVEQYESLGGRIEFGVKIDFAGSDLADGLINFGNGRQEAFDLIIGADGDHSKCREFLLGHKDEPVPTGWVSNRVVINAALALEDPELRPLYDPPTIRCWLGPSCAAITYLMHGKINVVFNSPLQEGEKPFVGARPVNVEEIQRLTEAWEPRIRKLMGLGTSILKWSSFQSTRLDDWVHPSNRVVLVGDSAHPVLHFLAHGAAMGMESASMLGNLLAKAASPADIPDLLRLYNDVRLPRTNIVRGASKKLGDLWHMPDGQVSDVRDLELLQGTPSIGFPNLLADPCFQNWLWSYDPTSEADTAYRKRFE